MSPQGRGVRREVGVQRTRRQDPGIGSVLLMLIGVAGVAMCITLVYLGGRAVMDVGGFCAEGGPYVVEQGCPEGTMPATLLGTLGLFLFGGMALVGGMMTGGFGWLPIACWTALFAVLGWSFLEDGLFGPPDGEVVGGWLISGVIFELMAWVPATVLVVAWWAARRSGLNLDVGVSGIEVTKAMPGPGQPARAASTPVDRMGPPAGEPRDRPSPEEAAELREIATAMGAVITDAAAETPADPARRAEATGADDALATADDATEFSEGSQALLDRLERLADMRDRGLLAPDEYETAKDAIMRELEARQ